MSETLKVLVVDDEPGMQTGAARALRDFTVRVPDIGEDVAFEVDHAESGEEALQRIEADPPCILLLDHKLPGMSGLDVLDRLADKHQDMLTIMITAYATLETAVDATKRGAYDFLAKPFTPAELRNVVRKATGRIVLARQARRLAQEKRRVRFEFISVLAHELKSPLAAVEGYLNIIRDRVAGDDLTAYDEMVARSLARLGGMRKLILDLLDLTRIESGQKRRELTDVDLPAVAGEVIQTLRADAEARRITVALRADGAGTLRADRGEIAIILANLLSNAIKYNRDGGRVDATCRRRGEEVVLEVADTGIGMAPEEAARLFNEFVRIKNDRTRGIPGSGLGLSIVRKLAALYGGEATVTSVPGRGSTFTVTLRDAAGVEE